MRDLTQTVHHPTISHEGYGSLAVPTYRASTIVFSDSASFATRANRYPDGYSYGLHGTPTTRTLEAQITALHNGVRTVLVPTGQAAVSLVFMTWLKVGDTVLIPDSVYTPIKLLCEDFLKPRGINYEVYDPLVGAGIEKLLHEKVKIVWTESPGSNTMEIQDIPAIVAACKFKGILVGCDNTWASPLLFKPLDHEADFAVEAITKYIGGHSDVMLGSVTLKDLALHLELKNTLKALGISISPDETALALRGIETMGMRLAHVGKIAEELARWLVDHPAVDQVLHPALESCPGHEIYKRDFAGSSGLFTVTLKPEARKRVDQALDALRFFAIGASWGGTHSLLAPQFPSKERSLSTWEEGAVLRISIGLEDPRDLKEDLQRAFDALLPPA